ncbi:hypothetical_protein [Leishmania braziliensis MHOM/BR/75/M2904]|uniref:Hypothetical_protein n=1 Tax=Leishmania braziliensis MHOM/BR/75/M2904 TaxID=420245 RepID=A0A3P3ZA67_LEIBR|nr:unnamed protein product [Leishmania braziliensis]SYZ67102.1 hypothetical_protein [Leishmania braziliensis MHOM/BR/75/M2904]
MRGSLCGSNDEKIGDLPVSTASGSRGTFPTDSDGKQAADGIHIRDVHLSLGQIDVVKESTVSAIAPLYTPPSPVLLGGLCGCMASIGITLLYGANYIPRLFAVEPLPVVIVIAGVFRVGVYCFTGALAHTLVLLCPRRRPDEV